MGQLKLDDRDVAILKVLSREGRISKAELAARINLSPSACWERLKRLEAARVITAYRAEIALARLAPHIVVFVAVELERHRAENFQTFERTVADYPEVVACWALGGGFDYLMQVVTVDIDSYQELIDDLLERKIGLARYYTYIVTKPVKGDGAPPFDQLLPDAAARNHPSDL